VPSAARSLTLAALRDLHGRRRLLTVAEVASALAISTAAVYTLCATGQLKHVRVLNQIRIPPTSVLGLLTRDQ
jgi:excisionase family DNA binding protein